MDTKCVENKEGQVDWNGSNQLALEKFDEAHVEYKFIEMDYNED